jgi:1-deoxy-D-xylulose-5-phosphate synthase
MQPKDEDELVDMMHTAIQLKRPVFVRYPRGAGTGVKIKSKPKTLGVGQAQVLREGDDLVLWALGPMVRDALEISDRLKLEDGLSAGVVNARFIKPLDNELLLSHAKENRLIVTLEDGVLSGGFGSAVLETLSEFEMATPVHRIGWPDEFIDHGSDIATLRAIGGLSFDDMISGIRKKLKTPSVAV